MEVLEIALEVLSLITASIALVLLIRARTARSFRPTIILLYLCIGFNAAETITRRFLRIKATAESATIETVTLALIVTALVYTLRARRRGTEGKLSPAIMCMVWAVTIFALELLLGFILSYYK